MGDLTQFDLKAKAWASKQKEGECVRDWAARLRLLMFYYMKKEILDSAKYKQQLVRGKYANSFSGEDRTHYDWATTDYWRQMLIYINDDKVTPPWQAACWERYEVTPEYARKNNRSMARSEGGPNLTENLTKKGRDKLLKEGPRVKMGVACQPLRLDVPFGTRALRDEVETEDGYIAQLDARNNIQEHDMPPGCRGAWPTTLGWTGNLTQRRGLHNTPGMRPAAEDAGIQDVRYMVLCEEEVPLVFSPENDPEGMLAAFHTPAVAGTTKWNQTRRFWDGFELFDTETPTRKGGTLQSRRAIVNEMIRKGYSTEGP